MSDAFRIANTYALLKPHQEKFLRADIEQALLAAEKRGMEEAVAIIDARAPIYPLPAQKNVIRECISCIRAAIRSK